jgi:predicted ribosome quality control (RQC) complex YloA/Tae2 family protein
MRHLRRFDEGKKDRPNYKKMEIDGYMVYQGRDSAANDYVTMELADGDDYWFHAHKYPGSHVIIKVNDRIPTETVIMKAAEIAAKNSKSDKDEVEVVYCKKRFVTKEPGMNPGQVKVDYKNSYTITVSKK